ncbi:lysozyme C-like [Uloborus diversus]|uniref:lysozyme C-like n=1 Tax=Uloborus diversus TaxID=327109 RepID=UPI00240A0111|nr:lysozyme C-like [Uloborus diversus]
MMVKFCFISLAISCISLFRVSAVIINPCQLADIMMNNLKLKKSSAAQWVCLAKFASGFNTEAVNGPYKDGSYDFGIFQINDKFCRKGTKESCGVRCTDLVSNNVTLSAICGLVIQKKQGFNYWPSWENNCRNKDSSFYLQKCEFKTLSNG